MKRVLFLLIVVTANGFAQDTARVHADIPQMALKWSPFHLFSFYPTVQVSLEKRLVNRISLQIEGGYVLDYNGDPQRFDNKRGFKAKIEPRHYFPINGRRRVAYVAAEGYYNYVNFERSDWIEECYDPQCDHRYTRRYKYKVKYREPGVGAKIGFVYRYYNFLLDVNSGWAVRFVDYDFPSRQFEWINEGEEVFEIPNERDRTGLMPLIGVRIGYLIGRPRGKVPVQSPKSQAQSLKSQGGHQDLGMVPTFSRLPKGT